MAIGSGLGSQVMFGLETTYGTSVTPAYTLEATSVGLELQVEHMMAAGLRSGLRVMRSDRQVVNKKGVNGSIDTEIYSNGGTPVYWLIKAMGDSRAMGSIKTGSTAYTYTIQLGDPASGSSMTVQTGVADVGGTVRRMDATGCFITEFSLSNEVDGMLTMSATVDGRDYTPSSSAVTSATYSSSSEPLTYAGGSFSINGTTVPIRSYEVNVTHGYDLERYQINSTTLKSRPIINALDEITATISLEFGADSGSTWATDDLMTKYRAGTLLTNVIGQWTGTTAITGSTYPSTQVTIPKALITSATPTVAGPDIIMLDVEIMALDDGTNQPMTLTVVSSENAT